MSRILQDQHPQQQSLYHTLSSGEDGKAKKKKGEKEKRACTKQNQKVFKLNQSNDVLVFSLIHNDQTQPTTRQPANTGSTQP